MGIWFPTYRLHKIKEILEGPKYETAFNIVFRAACRWTDLKGSKHLDPRMLAITNKEPFTAEVHHYRSCYHTYTLWVGSVGSALYVISDGTGELLYADNLALVEFVKNIHSMRLEMYQIKSVNSDDVTKAAVLLGNEIKNQRATQGWSLDVEDNEATFPESWSNSCQIILIYTKNR